LFSNVKTIKCDVKKIFKTMSIRHNFYNIQDSRRYGVKIFIEIFNKNVNFSKNITIRLIKK